MSNTALWEGTVLKSYSEIQNLSMLKICTYKDETNSFLRYKTLMGLLHRNWPRHHMLPTSRNGKNIRNIKGRPRPNSVIPLRFFFMNVRGREWIEQVGWRRRSDPICPCWVRQFCIRPSTLILPDTQDRSQPVWCCSYWTVSRSCPLYCTWV